MASDPPRAPGHYKSSKHNILQFSIKLPWKKVTIITRGELSYLAPLGSENISAPYFKQCFFRGRGGVLPPD